MWRRRFWFSLKGKAGIPGQTEGRPATSIGPRVLPVGSLQQRDAQHLAPPIRVHANSDYYRNGDDPARLARFQVRRVDPQIGPGALDRPGEKGVHPLVDLRAQPRDLAL